MSSPDTGRHSRAAGMAFENHVYEKLTELVDRGYLLCATKIEPKMRSVGRRGKLSFVPTEKQGPDFVVCSIGKAYLALEVKYTRFGTLQRSNIPQEQQERLRATDGMLALSMMGGHFLVPFIGCPWRVARSAESLKFDSPNLRRYQFSDTDDFARILAAHFTERRYPLEYSGRACVQTTSLGGRL